MDVPEPPTNEDEDWHEIGTRSTVSMITKNPAAYDLPQSSDEDDDTAVPKRISPSLIIVVTILSDSVDVVVNADDLTESQIAQIEDIVKRKTECSADKIVISPVGKKK